MAALLCTPITALCDFLCTAPCRLCAGACRLCDGGLAGFCANPLAGFVLVTVATQLPLAVAAALALPGLLDGCRGSQWLLGMLLAAISHLLASVYVSNRVANRTDAALRDRHSAWARISHLLCRDPLIAFYILIVVFFAVWLIVGSAWSIGGRLDECDQDLGDSVNIALGLGWCYFFAGPTILTCSMCCACCDSTDYAADDAEFSAKAAEEEAKKAEKDAKKPKKKSAADNNGEDVEAPGTPPAEEPLLPPTAPPGNFTASGIPIGIPVPNDGKEAVVEAAAIVEEDPLPPPVPPPKPDTEARVY